MIIGGALVAVGALLSAIGVTTGNMTLQVIGAWLQAIGAFAALVGLLFQAFPWLFETLAALIAAANDKCSIVGKELLDRFVSDPRNKPLVDWIKDWWKFLGF